jgi:hypothetical protein
VTPTFQPRVEPIERLTSIQRRANHANQGGWVNLPKTAHDDVVYLLARAEAAEERERGLREALERLLYNAQLIFNKRPVRDWGETLAEAKAALAEHHPEAGAHHDLSSTASAE